MMIFIAVPFFKNVFFLKETLQSVISQTSPRWQLVVFDDSIESTESVRAQELILKINDPRIQYYRNPANIGMAKNWNQGLKKGKALFQENSQVIATVILHADDRLKPNYVEKMLQALLEHPEGAAFFCKTEIIDDHGKLTFSFADYYKNFLLPKKIGHKIVLTGFDAVKALISGNFIFCPSLCYRNESLYRYFDPELKMVTDFEFTLDLLMQGKTLIGLYETPLFQYRRHAQNTTQYLSQNLIRFNEEKTLYQNLAERLEKKGELQLSIQASSMGILKKNLVFLIMTSLLKGDFSQSKRYFGFLRSLL